jgi:hypothetical protein
MAGRAVSRLTPPNREPIARLDRVLEALRATGPDAYRADVDRLGVWWARCPACAAPGERRLQIVERSTTRVELICSLGCTPEAILIELRRAEEEYPRSWPDDADHPCPAWDAALADLLIASNRQLRVQRQAERRVSGAG